MNRPRAVALATLLATGLAAGLGAEERSPTSCVACHADGDLFEPEALAIVTGFATDVHHEVGLSCHDCHGGDPDPQWADDMDRAMDPAFAADPYRGAPAREAIPAACGRCHSDPELMKRYRPDARVDQEREFWTSGHGKALASGDPRVATCVDCHGVHAIRRPADPRSLVYPTRVAETCRSCHGDPVRMASPAGPRPIDQYPRWRSSVHAVALLERGDLSAPTCNDCHGNHGAAPPGLASVAFVCGQCHGREAELFRASPKRAKLDEHAEYLTAGADETCADCHAPPEPQAALAGVHSLTGCVTCHGAHAVIEPSVAMLTPLPAVPCAFCHEGRGDFAVDVPEPADAARRYQATRAQLIADTQAAGLADAALFDHLVDAALALPFHTVANDDGARTLRPEFARLFEKFRIGKTRVESEIEGVPVLTEVRHCGQCHASGSETGTDSAGYTASRQLLDGMHELTALAARAERTVARARRKGIESRPGMAAIDRAIDAQIQLEVLLHGFATGEDSVFGQKQREGLESARAALDAGQEALRELAGRRRGLLVALFFATLVMVALAWKIRTLTPSD